MNGSPLFRDAPPHSLPGRQKTSHPKGPMLRSLSFVAAMLLAGCATRPASPVPATGGLDLRSSWEAPLLRDVALDIGASAGESPVSSVAARREEWHAEGREPGFRYATPDLQNPPRGLLRRNRFTVKGGYYASDESALDDDGLIVNLAWMQTINQPFAMELELGYLEAEGRDRRFDAELWALPIMMNGRVNLQLGFLEIYGGIGIGTIFYDAEAKGSVVSIETDGFVIAGNGFIGSTISMGDHLVAGLEGKYYLTEEMHDIDTDLGGFAVMVTVGLRY
jgi:hypothetical protein